MKESALMPLLIEASVFLAAAALLIPLLKKIGVPSILGYLLVGLVLGPHGLAHLGEAVPFLSYLTLENTDQVKLLAEMGIVMLLFVIGLELSPQRLWQMRSLVFGLGSAQVAASAVVIGSVALLWGNSPMVATLLGASLALSSTAIVIQWLHEQRMFASTAGRTSFGILLLQDLAVIPILFLLTIFAAEPGQGVGLAILVALGKMALTVTLLYVVGQRVLRPVFVFANRYGGTEVFMALTLLVIVVTAIIAGLSGLSLALGAFLAGLLLAETEYRHEITNIMMPFKGILLGVFFVSFGMTIDVGYVLERPFMLVASAIGLMLIKAVVVYVLARLWRVPHPAALESAVLLPQAGEFGLLVIGTSVALGLMVADVGQFMLIVVGLTMFATPVLAPLAQRLGRWAESREATADMGMLTEEQENLKGHILLIGYGRMGKLVADVIGKEGVPVVAFDHDAQRVHNARQDGIAVYFGDAAKMATLKSGNIGDAYAVVLTINDPKATNRIVQQLRKRHPDLPVFARAEDVPQAQELKEKFKINAIPEHLAVSLELAEHVLKHCGLTHRQAQQAANQAGQEQQAESKHA